MVRTIMTRNLVHVRLFASGRMPTIKPLEVPLAVQEKVSIPRIDAPPPGQPLKNVNVYAGQSDPIVMEDNQYPRWLVKEVERPAKLDAEQFKKLDILPTRTELRLLNKRRIKQNNAESSA